MTLREVRIVTIVLIVVAGCVRSFDPMRVATTTPLALATGVGEGGLPVLRFGEYTIHDVEVTGPLRSRESGTVAAARNDMASFQYAVAHPSGERWEVRCDLAGHDAAHRTIATGNADASSLTCLLRRADREGPTYRLRAYGARSADLIAAPSLTGSVEPTLAEHEGRSDRTVEARSIFLPTFAIEGAGRAWGLSMSMREVTIDERGATRIRDAPAAEDAVGSFTVTGAEAVRIRDGLAPEIESLIAVAGSTLFVLAHPDSVAYPAIAVHGPVEARDVATVADLTLTSEGGCAVGTNGAAFCFSSRSGTNDVADGDVVGIAASNESVCLAMRDGVLRCGPILHDGLLLPRVLGAPHLSADVAMSVTETASLGACFSSSMGEVACIGDLRGTPIRRPPWDDDVGAAPVDGVRDVVELEFRRDGSKLALGRTRGGSVVVVSSTVCHGCERPAPDAVFTDGLATLTDAISLSLGPRVACVARRNGSVACWGEDVAYSTADASREARAPVTVEGVQDAVEVAVGWGHACARTRVGEVYCWGLNRDGQLGDGSTRNHLDARRVLGLRGTRSIVAAANRTCAIGADALPLCWGEDPGDDERSIASPTPIDLRSAFRPR